MAQVKISELPSASSLTGSEVLPIVQGGSTLGATVNQIKDKVQASTINVLKMNASSVQTLANIGELAFNPDTQTLDVRCSADVTLSIGQENYIRGKNAESSTILNGTVVYVSGGQGANSLIKRAGNADGTGERVIGVATQDIGANNIGFITTSGVVNKFNTSAYAEGTLLWLGTNGAMTNVKANTSVDQICIGVVLRAHATEGSILVAVKDDWKSKVNEIKSTLTSNTSRITELEAQRLCYGVEFTRGLDPAMTRWIGDTVYQSRHPVMAMFRVAKVKDGKVTGYFNQVNLFKMEDGTDSNIIIDGTIVTDDGSDVMLVNESPIYVLNGGTNETYERRLVGKAPFVYDGDAAIEIPAHGVCIDYSTIKDGKQRSIRDSTVAGTAGAGIGGISYLANGLGGIKAGVSRFNYELYARAKNTDTSKNVPYCNSFWLDRDVWHTLLCIKFKTKDYHGSAYAGKALSSNDGAPTVSTWGTVTGVRVTETNATLSYYNLSSGRFSSASGQPAVNFWNLLNGQRPLLKMFEAQLALSYAYANSIAPNTDFSYDGATYQYANIAGHNGLADAEMTGKLRKKVTVSFTGRDVTNNVDVTNMPIDYLLEQVIIKCRVATWGHMFCWTSGIDAWTDNTNYHFYQTADVNKATIDTDSAEKDHGVKYAFEDTYDKVTQIANGDDWVLRMNNKSLIIKTLGGSLHTGECAYSSKSGTATAGKKARKGVYFGGTAYSSNASSRYAYASSAATATYTDIAGGFRVALT
jgi:hypothetical protein